MPLGVNLRGIVTGLDIVYELTDESFNQINLSKFESLSMHSSLTASTSLLKRSLSIKDNRRTFFDNFISDKSLKLLDFKNLKVNKSHSVTFIIKNMSGIATNFNFESKNFNPGIERDLKYDMLHNPNNEELLRKTSMNSLYNNTNNNIVHTSTGINNNNNFNSYNSNSNLMGINDSYNSTKNTFTLRKSFLINKHKNKQVKHQLLSDAHEHINFTSAKGNEFTKMRQLEKDSVLFLSSKKGVAVIVEPRSGKLEPYTEALITVTIYNECVGDFEDELIASVKGLPERRFPINLRIRGNPLQLSPFQPGIDYIDSPPILKMGYVTTNFNQISKSFKVVNTGTNLISLDWKIFDYKDVLNPKGDIFKIKIQQSKNKESFSLCYSAIEPEEINTQNPNPDTNLDYFKISPKNVLIQPKGTQDLNVTFHADLEGLKSALIVAYPKFLDDMQKLNVKLSELALRVDAYGVKPNLIVDKKVIL